MATLPRYVEEIPNNLKLAASKIESGDIELALWILKKISDQIEAETPEKSEFYVTA